jgi:hypothetical protein
MLRQSASLANTSHACSFVWFFEFHRDLKSVSALRGLSSTRCLGWQPFCLRFFLRFSLAFSLALFSLASFPGVSAGGVATLAGLLEFAVLRAASSSAATCAASSADALSAAWRASSSYSVDSGAPAAASEAATLLLLRTLRGAGSRQRGSNTAAHAGVMQGASRSQPPSLCLSHSLSLPPSLAPSSQSRLKQKTRTRATKSCQGPRPAPRPPCPRTRLKAPPPTPYPQSAPPYNTFC